ncbi:MAG: Holliday junction resolvase RuvX [Patescibacteria group bacterium]|nr:Holliday junction resolvase RuvX [Patescibacteria group bacterium]
MKRYLGIDWGETRIGLASGDSESLMALPYKTVASVDVIEDIIKVEEIDEIIIGEPKRMTGENNDNKKYLDFVARLEFQFKIPVHMIDERLTSLAADNLTQHEKQGADRDSVAAMLILQSYFDQQQHE